jgi:hypothetical protein
VMKGIKWWKGKRGLLFFVAFKNSQFFRDNFL